jgi:hypothetical protein
LGINPVQMRAAGWEMKAATDFQAKYGAFKEVRNNDERNRHRDAEKVQTKIGGHLPGSSDLHPAELRQCRREGFWGKVLN